MHLLELLQKYYILSFFLSWRPPSFLFLSHLYADDALVDEVHAVTLVACPHHVLSSGHTHHLQSIHHLLQA